MIKNELLDLLAICWTAPVTMELIYEFHISWRNPSARRTSSDDDGLASAADQPKPLDTYLVELCRRPSEDRSPLNIDSAYLKVLQEFLLWHKVVLNGGTDHSAVPSGRQPYADEAKTGLLPAASNGSALKTRTFFAYDIG